MSFESIILMTGVHVYDLLEPDTNNLKDFILTTEAALTNAFTCDIFQQS
jgi:hypothetical protein